MLSSSEKPVSQLVSTHLNVSGASPRRPSVAFFRWEVTGEPLAVHFHLNTVELLEREAKRAGDQGISGILLGRREQGRQLSFIVEDFETLPTGGATSVAASRPGVAVPELTTDVRYLFAHGQLTSASSERRVLKEMLSRWHTNPEKRMSILGFFRTCPKGAALPDEDDFAVATLNPAKSEQLLLMIEPRAGQSFNASLFLAQSGAVQWKWPSVPFNRLDLAQISTPLRPSPPVNKPQEALPEPRETRQPKTVAAEEIAPREPMRPVTPDIPWKRNLVWVLAPLALAVLLGLGVLQLPGRSVLSIFSAPAGPSDASALGLTLNRTGRDWQVGWNRNAPVLQRAQGARLSITDGPIHKDIDLDAGELRNGSLIYTPLTDDVVLKLEALDATSGKLVSESTHIVAGLMPGLAPENLGAASRKTKSE